MGLLFVIKDKQQAIKKALSAPLMELHMKSQLNINYLSFLYFTVLLDLPTVTRRPCMLRSAAT